MKLLNPAWKITFVIIISLFCFSAKSQSPVILSSSPVGVHCESMTARLQINLINGTLSEMGVIWGTNSALVNSSTLGTLIGVTKSSRSIGTAPLGIHPIELADLSPATTYYYKAYATNENGTTYGSVITQATTGACPEYYSCSSPDTWDTDASCSTPGDVPTSSSICYMRHDWSNTSFDYTTNLSLIAFGYFASVLPYRMVVQSGGVAFQNGANFTAGFQLEVQAGGVYGHNGSIDLDAGTSGKITRLHNEGAVLLAGSFTNNLTLESFGDFCVTGTFQNQLTEGASVNGFFAQNMTTPTDYFTDATYGGGDGTPSMTSLIALPVELISFNAYPVNDNQGILSWTTATEVNASHFNIYSSTDGVNWVLVGVVPASGNSIDQIDYEFDVFKTSGNEATFYKLSEVDMDGFETDLRISNILWSLQQPIVSYNRRSRILSAISSEGKSFNQILIRNSSGQIVYQESFKGENRFRQITIPSLSKGVYFAQLFSGVIMYSSKFLF